MVSLNVPPHNDEAGNPLATREDYRAAAIIRTSEAKTFSEYYENARACVETYQWP